MPAGAAESTHKPQGASREKANLEWCGLWNLQNLTHYSTTIEVTTPLNISQRILPIGYQYSNLWGWVILIQTTTVGKNRFHFKVYSLPCKIKAGTQEKNLDAGTESKKMKDCCLPFFNHSLKDCIKPVSFWFKKTLLFLV